MEHLWSWAGAIVTALALIFLWAPLIGEAAEAHKKDIGAIRYLRGYPTDKGEKYGRIQVENDRIIFGSSDQREIYFEIPIKSIVEVIDKPLFFSNFTVYFLPRGQGWISYNYLIVKYLDERGAIQEDTFGTHPRTRQNTILKRLILTRMKSVGVPFDNVNSVRTLPQPEISEYIQEPQSLVWRCSLRIYLAACLGLSFLYTYDLFYNHKGNSNLHDDIWRFFCSLSLFGSDSRGGTIYALVLFTSVLGMFFVSFSTVLLFRFFCYSVLAAIFLYHTMNIILFRTVLAPDIPGNIVPLLTASIGLWLTSKYQKVSKIKEATTGSDERKYSNL